MKIVYMGTPDFAVAPLEAIIEAGHEVSAVVTQPDKQKGRGREVQMTPVKECALRHGIPVFQPVKIREKEAVKQLSKYSADIFVVAAFGQILSEEILNMPAFGCINIHASLLPAYRGAAPIQWVILNGETKTGVTIQQMEKGIDTGDMLLKAVVPIAPKETGESLHDKLMEAGAQLIVEALSKIEKRELTPEKQNDAFASHAARLTKSMGEIDWNKEAKVIERLVRGLNSWPSAYTYYHGKTLKIWEADVIEAAAEDAGAYEPGCVANVEKDFFDVYTGKELLRIRVLQLEGKRRMTVREFLAGYEVTPGMIFG
ncbi:MAG: methionyl-tRNA formyltransferase, partial [Lachnospiraceae bacterium]|nr:methionyl-tRNA formyltransferase [Lachnospiraceae bacterium]